MKKDKKEELRMMEESRTVTIKVEGDKFFIEADQDMTAYHWMIVLEGLMTTLVKSGDVGKKLVKESIDDINKLL